MHKLSPSHKKHPFRQEDARNEKPCCRCGNTNHTPYACGFQDAKCRYCKKVGHIECVCKSKAGCGFSKPKKTNWLESSTDNSPDPPTEVEVIWQLESSKPSRSHPYRVLLEVNKQSHTMEVDIGAAVSLISKELKDKLISSIPLSKLSLILRTYTSENVLVLGKMNVEVRYGAYTGNHTLQVVDSDGPPLLG